MRPLWVLRLLVATFPNSAVKWVWYKQKNSATYVQRLNRSQADMVPVLISVEASWGYLQKEDTKQQSKTQAKATPHSKIAKSCMVLYII